MWNLSVWIECIGVVSGCCCKEVYKFHHNLTYTYSTCITSFLRQHSYFFVHFLNLFFCFSLFSRGEITVDISWDGITVDISRDGITMDISKGA